MPNSISRFLLFTLLFSGSITILAQEDNQTQAFAQARFKQVKDVAYQITYYLEGGKPTYKGRCKIEFQLVGNKDLVVDFTGKSIDELILNNEHIDAFEFSAQKGTITIPAQLLKEGSCELEIAFEGIFSHQGQGFHQFFDPADGLEYLYTHLEPNDAHRVFPCFDQPDIRATYRVDVFSPTDWIVISNAPVESRIRVENMAHTTFRKTKAFSTYITQLTAGPFASFHDQSFRYPLGLYCRQSLAKYLNPDYLFESTRKGFDFFEAYFDYPYPFEKYDQIFCPEYNIGAMENVGAVTWNDSYHVFRQKPTRDQLIRRDITLFHEMAHMWFGDLVTMKWWNDLWLKESFATYMSYLALEGTGVQDAWTRSTYRKDTALFADQRPDTHPILAQVPDVRAAASIFDSITYGKGFAALRQLDNYLGGNVFRDGCRTYFKRHQWQAVTLHEFIAAMEESTGKSLADWNEKWLGRKGVNTMKLHLETKKGRISKAYVQQMPSEFNDILRPHATHLALFYQGKDGKAHLKETLSFNYDGATTPVPQLVGKSVPAFVLPNIHDIDFARIVLDDRSVKWLRSNMARLQETQTKVQTWRFLWDMVRENRFPSRDYLEMALERLPHEKEYSISSSLLERAEEIVYNYIPDETALTGYRNQLFDISKTFVFQEDTSYALRRQFWYSLLGNAHREEDYELLKKLFQGEVQAPSLKLDAEYKWDLIFALTRHDYEEALNMAQEHAKSYASERSQNALLAISAIEPDAEVKANLWNEIITGNRYSLSETFHLAGSLFPSYQKELHQPYIRKYFKELPGIYMNREYAFATRFAGVLFPDQGGEETVQLAEAFLQDENLDPTLAKLVLAPLDDLKRKLRIRKNWSMDEPSQL